MADARQSLIEALELLEALKPYVDIAEDLRGPFASAWKVALADAQRAAGEYARSREP